MKGIRSLISPKPGGQGSTIDGDAGEFVSQATEAPVARRSRFRKGCLSLSVASAAAGGRELFWSFRPLLYTQTNNNYIVSLNKFWGVFTLQYKLRRKGGGTT